MAENKEIKIALVVGIIMITICILTFIIVSSNKKEVGSLDVKVYRLYEKEGTENEHVYRECSIATEDLLTINREFKKIQKLDANEKVMGKQITGNYKIIANGTFIAFDADENNYVYRSDISAIFDYKSSLYKEVKELCE